MQFCHRSRWRGCRTAGRGGVWRQDILDPGPQPHDAAAGLNTRSLYGPGARMTICVGSSAQFTTLSTTAESPSRGGMDIGDLDLCRRPHSLTSALRFCGGGVRNGGPRGTAPGFSFPPVSASRPLPGCSPNAQQAGSGVSVVLASQ